MTRERELTVLEEAARKFLAVLLGAVLVMPVSLAGTAAAPVVPPDLEGVVLESVPAEWGDLVSPVPTEVSGLYVVVAQPYLALDPRAESFRARWDGRDVDPADPDAVAEVLGDPDLEGARVLVFSLWQSVEGRVSLLGFTDVRVAGGRFLVGDPVAVNAGAFDRSVGAWRMALLRRIRGGDRLRDESLAAEIMMYTALSGDGWVRDSWLDRLMSPGEDCAGSVDAKDECRDCCEEAHQPKYATCEFAGVLAASGACFISAACAALWSHCCVFFGGLANLFVRRACKRNVDEQVSLCTGVCKGALDLKMR